MQKSAQFVRSQRIERNPEGLLQRHQCLPDFSQRLQGLVLHSLYNRRLRPLKISLIRPNGHLNARLGTHYVTGNPLQWSCKRLQGLGVLEESNVPAFLNSEHWRLAGFGRVNDMAWA